SVWSNSVTGPAVPSASMTGRRLFSRRTEGEGCGAGARAVPFAVAERRTGFTESLVFGDAPKASKARTSIRKAFNSSGGWSHRPARQGLAAPARAAGPTRDRPRLFKDLFSHAQDRWTVLDKGVAASRRSPIDQDGGWFGSDRGTVTGKGWA